MKDGLELDDPNTWAPTPSSVLSAYLQRIHQASSRLPSRPWARPVGISMISKVDSK